MTPMKGQVRSCPFQQGVFHPWGGPDPLIFHLGKEIGGLFRLSQPFALVLFHWHLPLSMGKVKRIYAISYEGIVISFP